jgi:hypothetical protein
MYCCQNSIKYRGKDVLHLWKKAKCSRRDMARKKEDKHIAETKEKKIS